MMILSLALWWCHISKRSLPAQHGEALKNQLSLPVAMQLKRSMTSAALPCQEEPRQQTSSNWHKAHSYHAKKRKKKKTDMSGAFALRLRVSLYTLPCFPYVCTPLDSKQRGLLVPEYSANGKEAGAHQLGKKLLQLSLLLADESPNTPQASSHGHDCTRAGKQRCCQPVRKCST